MCNCIQYSVSTPFDMNELDRKHFHFCQPLFIVKFMSWVDMVSVERIWPSQSLYPIIREYDIFFAWVSRNLNFSISKFTYFFLTWKCTSTFRKEIKYAIKPLGYTVHTLTYAYNPTCMHTWFGFELLTRRKCSILSEHCFALSMKKMKKLFVLFTVVFFFRSFFLDKVLNSFWQHVENPFILYNSYAYTDTLSRPNTGHVTMAPFFLNHIYYCFYCSCYDFLFLYPFNVPLSFNIVIRHVTWHFLCSYSIVPDTRPMYSAENRFHII